ncbi:alpha/beta fold hydrolase [Paraherbaspirillum soli]|uniref:Alpha/beta fold hydrolase n=1 Tax=Paraherbaspirillum soli TaxID=631222 RepID=A0ABW0MDD1_9BURK
MEDMTMAALQHQASAPAAAAPVQLPLKLRLARLGYRLGGMLAPATAGRFAADAFGRSRMKGARTSFKLPLGAEAFGIVGNQDVQQGYVWKKNGPTALLVHGWGSDSSSMYGFVKPMQTLGFQVASFDAPAHGAAAGHKTTMTRFVNAVGATIDSLDNVQVVIAHSLGSIATVAALSQAGFARSVKCLVLLAAPSALSNVLERWSKDHLQLAPRIVQQVYRHLHADNGVPLSHWDIAVLGAGMQIPVLVLHDPQDPVVPFCEAERLAGSLHNVLLEQAPALGHSRILSAASVKQRVAEFVTDAIST